MPVMGDVQGTQPIIVVVAYAASASDIWLREIQLAAPCSVSDVVLQSGFERAYPTVDWQVCGVGIFGKPVTPQTLVAHGDRVEIYRALVFDPKESRRRRARHRQWLKQQQKGTQA